MEKERKPWRNGMKDEVVDEDDIGYGILFAVIIICIGALLIYGGV